jgi:predicted Fe-Mo cluster-binding NifX family protein
MKVLIASRGNTLDSALACDIENAEWYLVVDTGRHQIDALKACGQPLQTVLHGAVAHGITVILTGSQDQHSRVTSTGGLIRASCGGARTVGEALEAWLHGHQN